MLQACMKVEFALFTLIFVHFYLSSFPVNPSVKPEEKSQSKRLLFPR